LKRLLEYEPSKRITADEALSHEFFKEGPMFTSKYVFGFNGFGFIWGLYGVEVGME
jgi:serine/threonine protein kinase